MARPRKRNLSPGVIGLAEWKEARRVAACNAAARAFMALPPEERRRQLMAMVPIGFAVGEEKKPAEESPAKEPRSE